jgi:hypothetical protein
MALKLEFRMPFFAKHKEALAISSVFQIVLLFLTLTELNADLQAKLLLVAAIAYWSVVAVIMIRRDTGPTACDVFLLKWGYPLTIGMTVIMLAGALIGVVPAVKALRRR